MASRSDSTVMASCELTFTDCPCCNTLCLRPTILPCGHVTCRRCLRHLVEDGGSGPVCPFCGHSIPRGQGQTTTQLLDQLGRDVILGDLVSEKLARDIYVSCQNCPRNRLAAKVCLDCNVTLCQDCCDSHKSHATQGLYEKCASNVTPDQAVSATRAEDTMENHRRERTMLEDKEEELCEAECSVEGTMADLQRVLQVVRERKAVLQTYSTRLPTVVNISKLEARLKCLRLESCPPSLSAMLANLRRDTEQCIALWTTAGHTPVKTLDTVPVPTPIPPEYRVNVQQAGQVHVAQNMVEIHVTRGDSTSDEAAGGEGQLIPHVERLLLAHHATIINLNLGPVGVDQITDDRITQAVEDVLVVKIDWAKERARAQELKAEKQRLARQVESERVKGQKAVDEAQRQANARLEQLYHEHQQEKRRERAKMKTFVMKIEEKNKRLLEQLMERLGQEAVLGKIIQRLFEEFDVRLLGVTCGLSFLMDTPDEEWERVQQRQADVQRTLLSGTVDATFTQVMPYDADTDIDLRLGRPLPAPSTCQQGSSNGGTGTSGIDSATGTFNEEFRLLLLGGTGSGKSMTGNTIFGEELFQDSADFALVTADCELRQSYRDGRKMKIMDTPGLYDTSRYAVIIQSVAGMQPGPNAILYVVKVGRYTPEDYSIYTRLKALFDPSIIRYMIVVFTGGDSLGRSDKSIQSLLPSSPENLKTVLTECSNRCVLFNNFATDPRPQVERLLDMVRQLNRQNGGPYVCSKYMKIGQSLEAEVARRMEEVDKKELERQKYVQQLQKQTEDTQQALSRTKEDMQRKEQEQQRQMEQLAKQQMEQQKLSDEKRLQEERALWARQKEELQKIVKWMEQQRREDLKRFQEMEEKRQRLEAERAQKEREMQEERDRRHEKEMNRSSNGKRSFWWLLKPQTKEQKLSDEKRLQEERALRAFRKQKEQHKFLKSIGQQHQRQMEQLAKQQEQQMKLLKQQMEQQKLSDEKRLQEERALRERQLEEQQRMVERMEQQLREDLQRF